MCALTASKLPQNQEVIFPLSSHQGPGIILIKGNALFWGLTPPLWSGAACSMWRKNVQGQFNLQ